MRSLIRKLGGKAAARLVGLGLLVGLLAILAIDPLVISNFRNQQFDLMQRLKPRPVEALPVVIVDVDEPSLARYGQWPWPRTRMAELVDKLTQLGAVAIGFDMVFAEPDRLSPVRIAQDNPDLPPAAREALGVLPANEVVFAEAIARSRVVLGETVSRTADPSQPAPPQLPIGLRQMDGDGATPPLPDFASLVQNLPVLSEAAAGRGVFTVDPDPDNVFRRVPLAMVVGGTPRFALSTELLRIALGADTSMIRYDTVYGVRDVVVSRNPVPTDANGRIWPWFSPSMRERYLSVGAVLSGEAPPQAVAGKLVLIGTSAVGLEDYRATPIAAQMPGVEIHAQMIENILTSQYLSRPSWAAAVEFAITLVAGLLIIWLVPLLGALWAAVAAVVFIGGFGSGSWLAFDQYRLLLDGTFPTLASLALFITMAMANYMREEVQKRQIRGAFGQYLSPALVDQLSRNPDLLKLGGETRELSVLFTDVRGFTGISEAYKANPQGLTRLMNRFLTVMSQPILDQRGTIDKYMGDAIMAFWNAPLDEPEHALRSCRAALAMIANVSALNEQRRQELAGNTEESFREINVGIGINTGTCVVGNMGSEMRFDYTALGDTVNIASRLEGQSKPFGLSIIMGSRTAEAVRDRLAVIEIDLIRVKGKAEPERIYALIGDEAMLASVDYLAVRAMNMAMISAYRRQDWEASFQANEELAALGDRIGLDLTDYLFVYESRIAEYRANPPGPNWDAVYVATEK